MSTDFTYSDSHGNPRDGSFMIKYISKGPNSINYDIYYAYNQENIYQGTNNLDLPFGIKTKIVVPFQRNDMTFVRDL